MWPFSSGSSSSSSSSQVPEPVAAAPPLNASTDSFTDPAQSAYPANPSAAPANDDTTSYLRSSQFTSTSPSGGYGDYTPTAADLLSSPAFDPARLHPLAGLGKDEVEYLDIVDNQPSTLQGARTALPSRGWSDDLCYGTGTTYLSGLAVGGLLGVREGLARPLAVQNPTFRLRLNAVLNQVTRRGSFLGNSAGVVALIYNLVDATIDYSRGKHDMAGSLAAGAVSGALFKCTAGPRAMAVASGIMMAAAGTWTTAKQALL